jgi:hypothetical protein
MPYNPRRTILKSKENNLGMMLNQALEVAKDYKCDIFSILDDDDEYVSDRLEKIVRAYTTANTHGISCLQMTINEKIIDTSIIETFRWRQKLDTFSIVPYNDKNYRNPGQFTYDNYALDVCKGYPPESISPEHYFLRKFMENNAIAICPEYLFRYHIRENEHKPGEGELPNLNTITYDNNISHIHRDMEISQLISIAQSEKNNGLISYFTNLLKETKNDI